jgi:hypothetical protein
LWKFGAGHCLVQTHHHIVTMTPFPVNPRTQQGKNATNQLSFSVLFPLDYLEIDGDVTRIWDGRRCRLIHFVQKHKCNNGGCGLDTEQIALSGDEFLRPRNYSFVVKISPRVGKGESLD